MTRKLLSTERENLILKALGDGGRAIAELSAELGVSEATVRRDLRALEDQGKVRRVHGGAIRTKFPRTEPLFTQKASLNAGEKRRIAELALTLIEDGDTIYLDGGSTVLGLAPLLEAKNDLTVVTNSLMAAAELMESDHHLILVGGEFRPLSRTLVGPLTAKVIDALHVDKAFMGSIGFTVSEGMSTTDPNEAYTKELIMRRARRVALLIDSSKIGTPSLAVSGSPGDVDVVVTDVGIPENVVRQLKRKKIEVLK